jgi:hypothetical protein
MAVNSENQLKFEEGRTTEPLTIMDAGIEEFPFGSKYVVRINPLITGHDHFMPSPGLKKKIEEINVDVGDVITVEKVAPSEKYQYGYFSIDMANNPVKKVDPAIHESPMGAGFAQKDDKMTLHELTLRFEALEKVVAELKKDALPF